MLTYPSDSLAGQALRPVSQHIAAPGRAARTGPHHGNKEIGQRLYLSHRTVGGHLYQIFPKLRVTTRAALRDALTVVSPQ